MTTDLLLAKRPRLRTDLLFSRELTRGATRVYLVKDRANNRAFEIAAKERFLLERLDGERSLAEIGDEYAGRFGRRLAAEHWTRLLWLLHQRELLDGGPVATADAAEAERLVDRWARVLGRIVSRPVVVAIVVAIVGLLAALAVDVGDLWRAARPVTGRPWDIVAVVAVTWLSAALHEFAHGLAARHHGCTVGRINLFTLTCTVADYLYLPSRTGQVFIAAAGGLANGVFLLPFGLAWLLLPDGAPGRTTLAALVLVGSAQTLVNYVPLAPLDGYKMCGHALGMLNLAPESRRYLRRLGRGYPRAAAGWLAAYGVTWFVLVGVIAVGVVVVGGGFLAGPLGSAAYPAVAAVVGLTVAGWLARPRRTPAPTHLSEETP
jgi:putative peptide zinc metalloprotease protein